MEGDRWIDLKRTSTIDAVMGGTLSTCAAKSLIPTAYIYYIPVKTAMMKLFP